MLTDRKLREEDVSTLMSRQIAVGMDETEAILLLAYMVRSQ